MEVFIGQEEMVAGPPYYRTYYFRIADYIGRYFGIGSIYIYLVLMKQSPRHKELETILVLVLVPVACYLAYRKPWLLMFSLITGITGLLVPVAGKVVHELWMKFAELLGFVTNRVILAAIFFVIVCPLGWISKKLGKSSIVIKPGAVSNFKERNHTYSKEDLENMW
jgi:hypothetical protein